MEVEVLSDVPVMYYRGPKKPAMPEKETKSTVLPLKILAHQSVLMERCHYIDFQFLKDIVSNNTPEYNGYNTALARDQGLCPKKRH